VLGDRPATVREASSFDIHGVTYHDVVLTFEDGSGVSARLGPEAVPETLQAGDQVVVTMAAGLVLSIRRP
jgi:hypothetical protein